MFIDKVTRRECKQNFELMIEPFSKKERRHEIINDFFVRNKSKKKLSVTMIDNVSI